MRKSPFAVIAVTALMLSGCASTPEPTFAQLLGNRVSEYAAVKKDWQSGAVLKADGEKEIARGKSDIKKGEDLIKHGEKLVKHGEDNAKKGAERMHKAEADYSALASAPAVPDLVE